MASKRGRTDGRRVTNSVRNNRRDPSGADDEMTPSPPPPIRRNLAALPTPESSSGVDSAIRHRGGNMFREFGGSSSNVFYSQDEEYDNDDEEDEEYDAEEHGPQIEDLIPSFKCHVAYKLLKSHDRGVLMGHHRSNSVKTWRIVDAEAAQLVTDSGLGWLADLMYDTFDMPLLCAFVERWHPETNTFHLPCGELTITLHDTQYILGLRASGKPICPPCEGSPATILQALGTGIGIRNGTQVKQTVNWLSSNAKQSAMRALAEDPRCPASRKARIYLWWVLTSTLFVDKSKTHGYASFIELLRSPESATEYAWGAGALANLYRELGMASRSDAKQIAGCLTLLQAWIYAYFPRTRPQERKTWHEGIPCASMWIPQRPNRSDVANDCLVEHRRYLDGITAESVDWLPFGPHPGSRIPISLFKGIIHCRSINEPYMPDRVARQFGYRQEIPVAPIRPRKSNRSNNPREYNVQHDPAHWVFELGESCITFRGISEAQCASECASEYMDWYTPRTVTRLVLGADSDDDENQTHPLYDDPHEVLQTIAGHVTAYHRSRYTSRVEPEGSVLVTIADLCERMMPDLRLGRRDRRA